MNLAYLYIVIALLLEMLPISSSTHMHFLTQFLQLFDSNFYNTVWVQALDELAMGGIFLVVILFFFKQWWFIARSLNRTYPIVLKIVMLGIITELITTIFFIGVSYNGTQVFPTSLGFLITTVLLYSLKFIPSAHNRWNTVNAGILGIAQGIAFMPGISRFASTYVIARWLGISARRSFQICFLIEMPLALTAGVKGSYWFYQSGLLSITIVQLWVIVLGILGAYSILFLMYRLIVYNTLWVFAFYTGLLSGILFLM